MTIADILADLEKSNYEISTESRLARVGLKDAQEIAPILEKYRWLCEIDTVRFAKDSWEKEIDPARREELRRVFFELAGMYLYRKVAPLGDEITTFFAKAEVEVDGEKIPYHNLRPLTAKTADFDRRERLLTASLPVIAEANPKELVLLEETIKGMREDLGYAGYLEYYAAAKTMDYAKFQILVDALAAELEPLYRERMGETVERKIGRPWPGLLSCHSSYLMFMNQWDSSFPKAKLEPAFRASLAAFGIDLDAQINIRIDTADRPKKNPRAVCYSAIVPDEVHLIIKPAGGYYDFRAFFHEGGHAEHYGNTDPALPYALRHLATSHAYTELFSYTFESLTRHPGWLTRYLDIPPETAVQIAREAELADLAVLVRYFGKFSYEHALFSGGGLERAPDLYADQLLRHTGFRYSPVMHLDDMDGGFYSADYLRAWLGRAQLAAYLEKEAGEEWFASPRTGEILREMWRSGTRYELEGQIERMGIGRGFDPAPLAAGFRRALG